MTDSQPVPEQRSLNPEIAGFENFAKLREKTELLEKIELPDEGGLELMGKRGADLCPPAKPHS